LPILLTNQPINQSTNQPINQSTNQPINQSTNQPINKSTNQPITYHGNSNQMDHYMALSKWQIQHTINNPHAIMINDPVENTLIWFHVVSS